MYIQQIYTNCLAHAAYYIESDGEAAVIDPLRDPEPYLKLAQERGAKIRYVFETHFHADFVSGHIDLAARSGGTVVFGPTATPGYAARVAVDGQLFPLGKINIRVLHTPGHTIESACFLLIDELGKDHAVFTGDTLFVGDVGRPDLLSGNLSKEELAAMLYESLKNKIKTLPADVIVYPGHGAGSACGKNISKQAYSTIGEQMETNYALLATDKDEFISKVTSDLPAPPPYFFKDAAINKTGYKDFQQVIDVSLKALPVDEFIKQQLQGALILDTRDALSFGSGFINGAVNIGLGGDFAVWVGTLIDFDRPLLLVTDEGKEREAITRLARIGYEHVVGCLDGGMPAWIAAGRPVDTIDTYMHTVYEPLLQSSSVTLLDVRRDGEVAQEKMKGSIYLSLSRLPVGVNALDANGRYLVYCAGGYRSMIAASILRRHGIRNVACIHGGISEVKKVAPSLVQSVAAVY